MGLVLAELCGNGLMGSVDKKFKVDLITLFRRDP